MKYIIQKTDGTPVDPNAVYFVLRLDKPDEHGKICRNLVGEYAEKMSTINPDVALAAAETLLKAGRNSHARRH